MMDFNMQAVHLYTGKLDSALKKNTGLLAVIGKSGVGKTYLAQHLVRSVLSPKTIMLTLARCDRGKFVERLSDALLKKNLDEYCGFEQVRQYVKDKLKSSQVIIIDQSQNLSRSDWHDLIEIMAIKGNKQARLQFIVLGQTLSNEAMQCSDKMILRLEPLYGSKLVTYIQNFFQEKHTMDAPQMTLIAIWVMGLCSSGLPKYINPLLDYCCENRNMTVGRLSSFDVLSGYGYLNSGHHFINRDILASISMLMKSLPVYVWLIVFFLMQAWILNISQWFSIDTAQNKAVSQTSIAPSPLQSHSGVDYALSKSVDLSKQGFRLELSTSSLKDSLRDAISKQESEEINTLISHSTPSEFSDNFSLIKPILERNAPWLDGESICRHSVDSIADTSVVMTCSDWMMEMGQYQKALNLFTLNLSAISGHVDYFERKAYLLLKVGKSQEAISQYQRLLDFNANQASWWLGLGSAYKAYGNMIESKHAFEKALAYAPKTAEYKSFLIREING